MALNRILKWSPFPDNCWVGVTATDANMFLDALDYLDDIQCKVRYVSLEPLLGSLYLEDLPAYIAGTLDWLIIGACTGTKTEMSELVRKHPELTLMPYGNKWTAQPKIEWVEEIVRAADKAGIPVFLKDNLIPILPANTYKSPFHFGIHGIRQEMVSG